MLWAPPFVEGEETVVYESDRRMSGHRYSEDYRWVFVTQRPGGGRRRIRCGSVEVGAAAGSSEYAMHLDDPETRYTISEWDSDEFYENPGSLVMAGGGGGGRFFGFGGGGGGGHFVESRGRR